MRQNRSSTAYSTIPLMTGIFSTSRLFRTCRSVLNSQYMTPITRMKKPAVMKQVGEEPRHEEQHRVASGRSASSSSNSGLNCGST